MRARNGFVFGNNSRWIGLSWPLTRFFVVYCFFIRGGTDCVGEQDIYCIYIQFIDQTAKSRPRTARCFVAFEHSIHRLNAANGGQTRFYIKLVRPFRIGYDLIAIAFWKTIILR